FPDVLVIDGCRRLGVTRRQGGAVEAVLQDRVDVAVRPTTHGECADARGLESIAAVLLLEPDDPEARSEAVLRVLALGEDLLCKQRGVLADRLRPVDDPLWCPLGMLEVSHRAVLVGSRVATTVIAAQVRANALLAVVDLDSECGRADPDLVPLELVRRRVEVVVV